MIIKLLPHPNKLPTDLNQIAATLEVFVTCMENYVPAFQKVASLPHGHPHRVNAVSEIKNIEYQLRSLQMAFGIQS